MVIYCTVCMNNTRHVKNISYFSYPKDRHIRNQWLQAVGREDLIPKLVDDYRVRQQYRICEDHFEKSCIKKSCINVFSNKSVKYLYAYAFPTLNLPPRDEASSSKQAVNGNAILDRSERNEPSFKKSEGYCITMGCFNSRREMPNLYFFTLPKDETRRQQWLTAVGREDLMSKEDLQVTNYEVCSEHFLESAISGNKNMNVDAVPTLKLPAVPYEKKKVDPDDQTTIFDDTETELSVSTRATTMTHTTVPIKAIPRKQKLARVLNQIKNVLDVKTEYNDRQCKSNNMVNYSRAKKSHLITKLNKLLEWKMSKKDKIACAMKLQYFYPQAYRCLRTVLKLPSKNTILKNFKLKSSPMMGTQILDGMLAKLNSLPESAKYCSICIDEIVLRQNLYYDVQKDIIIGLRNINGQMSLEVANRAYVALLQGICYEWKHPVSYAFVANTEPVELETWLDEVIQKLFDVGIKVKAIVSSQRSNFDNFSKINKKVTVHKPYFVHDSSKQKIYYIFDVPHLLKCVRNELLSNDIHYYGDVIMWDYIKTLYEDQKKKNMRLIPKLSDAHIQPNNYQKTETKFAAQVFSHSVSAALETYIDFGQIHVEARATAKFIQSMNDIFDALNCKEYSFTSNLQRQKRKLEETKSTFSAIKIYNRSTGQDITDHIKTFENFQITIRSILSLHGDLEIEGIQHLVTGRLNRDNIVSLLKTIRTQNGYKRKPTAFQFTKAFSKLYIYHMLQNPSAGCKLDLNKIINATEDILDTNEPLINSDETLPSVISLDGNTDHRMQIPEPGGHIYIAGYLMYKCSQEHFCDKMANDLQNSANFSDTSLHFNYKYYNVDAPFYGKLKLPSANMIEYVRTLESEFMNSVNKLPRPRLGDAMLPYLKNVPLQGPCNCFPKDYFIRLFIRLRIYSILKYNNCYLKKCDGSGKQHLKVKQICKTRTLKFQNFLQLRNKEIDQGNQEI